MPGWNDSDELTVASSGAAYVAPVGTALPATPTAALNSAFVGLGFISEDGATLTVDPDITEFKAWQSRQSIRRELNAQEIRAAFELQQWNEETVPLAFGGGAITEPSAGIYRYDFPEDGDALDERALILDAVDGSKHFRYVFPRGNVTENVETKFARNQLSQLPLTFKALEPVEGGAAAYFLTDSPEFAAGS